ncbi:hypothetical protein Scep_024643 [Stephania cephalantha]|uniref:RING-type E3 ubiquitin transferase n=1 Tax=Stephania cephalantha TaxID=152367 RepID=A0AAP0F482_9MAGN
MNWNQEERLIIFPLFLLLIRNIHAQTNDNETTTAEPPSIGGSFRPGVAIVVGVLSIMFTITILLVVYAKFCHRSSPQYLHRDINPNLLHQANRALLRSRSRSSSGIDKTVIESLPFFRFSSLKGEKEGLECAVCLSKFEDSELLRLLPKCKHAFHIGCVDKWLESHSSCPICRHKVDPTDPAIFTNSSSLSFSSRNHQELIEDPNIELFVRREVDQNGLSSRFSIGSSFRKILEKGKKEEFLIQECGAVDDDDDDEKNANHLHKVKHKIIVSDVLLKHRWSNLSSSDIMNLNVDMLNATSSQRFIPTFGSNRMLPLSSTFLSSIEQSSWAKSDDHQRMLKISSSTAPSTSSDVEANITSDGKLGHSGKRSMSEIANFSRLVSVGNKGSSSQGLVWERVCSDERGDRRRRLWFPIVRKTVQWLKGRERR